MSREYLLKELISQEFLPAHGFPLHVATFDTMHLALFRRSIEKKNAGKRWPTCFCGESCPVVPFPSALTEYAPGNSVAINGLVYEVKGHNPELAYSRFRRGRRGTAEHTKPLEVPELRQFRHGGQPFPTTCSNCGAA